MRCAPSPRSATPTMTSAALAALALTLAAGCDTRPSPPIVPTVGSPSAATPAAPPVGAPTRAGAGSTARVDVFPKPMLPVAPTKAELAAGKADFYDDYRNANLDVYGITASPSTPVIPSAEFDAKQALMLSWTGSFSDVVADIVSNANPVTDVIVVADGTSAYSSFQNAMASQGVSTAGVQHLNVDNQTLWIRDFGPISVHHAATGRPGLIDPRYYDTRHLDDAIPYHAGAALGLTGFRMPVDVEGGNFMADGRGTCFVSQGVLWFNGASESQIRKYFRDYLGCYQLVIVNPLDGEGTTHIDMFSKLVDEDTVLLGEYTAAQDATNKGLMDANEAIYDATVLAGGGALEVVRMPMPSNSDGAYRTYINSQFINGVNLIPTYTDDTTYEAQALAQWASVMPAWSHVPLDATQLIQWSGAIHCILMEVQQGPSGAFQSDPTGICGAYDCYPTSTLQDAGCGTLSTVGVCEAGVASWCDGGVTESQDCGGSGQGCVFVAEAGHFGCVDGSGCVPDCTGKACGNDGCGGVCGACGGGEVCNAGTCEPDTPECGDVTPIGCCEGDTLQYCNNAGSLTELTCGSGCGWDASGNGGEGWYDCGFTEADPAGTHPLTCGGDVCTPDCDGKACGDDGCGGSCGSCGSGEACDGAGQCVCVPGCDGLACGDDGCGGSCGSCPAGQECDGLGQCVDTVDPCGGVTFEGCCDGLTLSYCEGGALQTLTCESSCGWSAGNGYYDCAETGEEPTGTFPLLCPGACVPDCTGKACGGDGCGGSCGDCSAGAACDAAGQCVALCVPACDGKSCGDDGCGGSCGTCPGGQLCGATGQCESLCVPDCAGKACGDDGCGGACGVCGDGELCDAGACEGLPATGCGTVSYEGLCDEGTLYWCDGGELVTASCSTGCCAWQASASFYDCQNVAVCQDCVDECAPGQTGCSSEGTHAWACVQAAGKSCFVREWSLCDGGCDSEVGACVGGATCLAPSGDVNGDGVTSWWDVLCERRMAKWVTYGMPGPVPTCAGSLAKADVTCDGTVDAQDVSLVTRFALGFNAPSSLDGDGDGCVDACVP